MDSSVTDYVNILVHVDADPVCDARVAAAVQFAQNTGAQLTGVYAIPDVTLPPYAGYARAKQGVDLLKALEAEQKSRAEQAEAKFNRELEAAGIPGEWHASWSTPFDCVAWQARYSDLVLLGQTDPDDWHPSAQTFLGALVLGSGRPVIVLPRVQTPALPAEQVLVAWDGSREAVRSVNDALPLLSAAQEVVVVGVRESHRDLTDSCAHICRQLGRHGIEAEMEAVDAEGNGVGDTVLSHANNRSAGMIVMGGYGHSRLRELVLGGVTRHVLTHANLPVFLSH